MIRICYNPQSKTLCIGNLKTKKASSFWCEQYRDAVSEYRHRAEYSPCHSLFTNCKSYIYIDIDPSIDLYDVPNLCPELFL